jgi:hypothetical protein
MENKINPKIVVTPSTKIALDELAERKGETYNDILNKLIIAYKKRK